MAGTGYWPSRTRPSTAVSPASATPPSSTTASGRARARRATFLCTEKPAFSRLASIAPDDVFERQGRRTVAREIAVPTVSLADLLDRHDAPERIDYISVDTEGAERAILEAHDFGRQVSLWTVEHNFTPEREAVHALMERRGYVRRFPEF